MIDPDRRNAVFTLHQEGMAAREISQRLNISRNTVGVIIRLRRLQWQLLLDTRY